MDELLHNDSYNLFVPIEDHDLMKSVSVDENGDYIVQGVMTSDDKDEEDDSITPEGMDCSYFLTKGWIKYEHGNKPEQFIGEPLEVKVGRFEHPTLMKSVNGIFVKGRLFAARGMTKSAIEAINDLQKSNTKRRMGWSIEGNVKARNEDGKVVKSILRNVVLTMNPVNTTTWAELAKSFAKNHELDIDMDMSKAMDIATAAEISPQSLEGAHPKKKVADPQDDWINHFREFVKKAMVEKSFRNEFVKSPEEAELLAFGEALAKGMDMEEADAFASYITERHELLKSLVINFGGENMSIEAKNKLASLLDADLEELKKSIDAEDEAEDSEDDEELSKSIGDDEDDDSSEEDEENEESDDSDDDEEETEEEDESDEKGAGGSTLKKSLAASGHSQAFEVSDFLTSIADEIGFGLEGMEKSIMNVTKQNHAITKSLATFGSVMQKAMETIEAQAGQIDDLQKSLSEVMNRPVGRKGVVNQREVQTLSKSINNQGAPKAMNRAQIVETLFKSFEAGEIPGSAVSRYEAGVPLESLGLAPDYLKKSFGLGN